MIDMEAIMNIKYPFTEFISFRNKKPYSLLFYVIENANWSIKWDGKYITENLNNQGLLKAKTTTTYKGIGNQIIHFGSRNLFLPDTWEKVDNSNKIVFTWFHGTDKDKSPENLAMINALPEASKKADMMHTACNLSKEKLVKWGVPGDKIVVIPLGVDLNIFKPVSEEKKKHIRKNIGLPPDKIILGSFQKDGVGWGEGLDPKWVKGPDTFVEVASKLKENHDIFVLLTGPARGYVKKGLDKRGIGYKHIFLENYLEIPKYYNALDLYLVTSREEGGPKAIVESMASGVPIVSTKVGMSPDIINDGYDGFLTDIEDVEGLVEKASKVIENKKLRDKLINNALNIVKDYSWENIAKRYYKEIYHKLLN